MQIAVFSPALSFFHSTTRFSLAFNGRCTCHYPSDVSCSLIPLFSTPDIAKYSHCVHYFLLNDAQRIQAECLTLLSCAHCVQSSSSRFFSVTKCASFILFSTSLCKGVHISNFGISHIIAQAAVKVCLFGFIKL